VTLVGFSSSKSLGKPGGVMVYSWGADQEVAIWMPLGVSMFGEAPEDYIYFVALSFDGSVVAIGAIDNDGSSVGAFNRGHVRALDLVADSMWVQRGTDLEADPLHGEECGAYIDLNDDGSVVAIGDPLFERSKSAKSGAVSIFHYDRENWALQGTPIEGSGLDQLGRSLSLSGDGSVVVLGAPRLAFPDDIGYAIVFHWVRDSWVRLGEELSLSQQGQTEFRILCWNISRWSNGSSG
jgi:hypothetical protein